MLKSSRTQADLPFRLGLPAVAHGRRGEGRGGDPAGRAAAADRRAGDSLTGAARSWLVVFGNRLTYVWGRAAEIMRSPESFERSENERHILEPLARGEREISKGRGYDLDSVLGELDELLAQRP